MRTWVASASESPPGPGKEDGAFNPLPPHSMSLCHSALSTWRGGSWSCYCCWRSTPLAPLAPEALVLPRNFYFFFPFEKAQHEPIRIVKGFCFFFVFCFAFGFSEAPALLLLFLFCFLRKPLAHSQKARCPVMSRRIWLICASSWWVERRKSSSSPQTTLPLTSQSTCMTTGPWTGKKSRSAARTFFDSFIKADFYTETSP